MTYPEIPLAQSIIEILKAKGIQDIIISPGSRNAPLTIGFASDPFFKCYSIADERCAAFFGLGIAQQTHNPVALVCTSGSALLNYYPAIAEAFYSQIPLIVVSADRPLSKIDIGDGQTIRQQNVYENHSLFNANLTEEASPKNDILIQKSIQICIEQKGPVHINTPFEEPLYNTLNKPTYKAEIKKDTKKETSTIDFTYYKDYWKKTDKKLLLIGTQSPDTISADLIEKWANDPSLLVFTEVTSNVHHPNFISSIDALITAFTDEENQLLQPELLISIGGMIVSKRIKAFLRKYKAKQHWHIDPLRAYNTFGILSNAISVSPQTFFEHILTNYATTSTYRDQLLKIRNERSSAQKAYLKNTPFSDLKVFELIWRHLPSDILLQISNSSPIRYAQLFDTPKDIKAFCNRGTSGIDGCTSTAIGAAVSHQHPTLLITGDISFLYDSNALWNSYIPPNFKIIIINNGGGGIFRILPGHQENAIFNTFFETEHQLNAKYLTEMYRLKYRSANDIQTTEKELQELFLENEQPVILEIFTPTKENQEMLKEYFNTTISTSKKRI